MSAVSRSGAIALLGLLIGVVHFGVARPVVDRLTANQDSVETAARTAGRLKAALQASEHRQPPTTDRDRDSLRRHFLRSGEDNLVLADLQTRLRSLATDKHSELLSARTLPSRSDNDLDHVGLALQVRGELKNIQEILHAIEFGSPYLSIRKATLRLDDRRAGIRDAVSQKPRLLADLEVYGAKWESAPRAPSQQQSAARP